ncbi:hypothetical protein BAU15_03610 [Enterococcus sp. JM4C]|uniref:hypothetical protein n=1 Tax=Candidatus Enterococcus huntleyi TaxID=1857217 RepID=UPI001F2F6861|nr:hypothetical protein [Enterococcus sp. JM4C]KAF1295639.1 hypothetical protein BAU15_03610 [Enterococcus sp. JM4C]
MNTYVKISDTQNGAYYYALVHFSGEHLTLRSSQGIFRKKLNKKISLAAIKNLVLDKFWGGHRITFTFENENYTFFESGTGVVDYLQTNLSL